MRVAFLLQDLQLSGGVGVVVEHAGRLVRDHGFDVRLVLTRPQDVAPWPYAGLRQVPVLALQEAEREKFDVAVSTWWQTTADLFRLDAHRYAYFIQSFEDRTYGQHTPERLAAALTTALPVRFVTEARWIAHGIEELQPGTRALYVRNGVAKDVFVSPPEVVPKSLDEPLRIVIEGSRAVPFKGVDEALAAVRLMKERRKLTIVSPHPEDRDLPEVDRHVSGLSHTDMARLLREQHVMLKLSRVEGMYGPPLEAFHMGATCVTTPVTGFDEYVRHAENGLVVGWDDPRGTARALDLLARDSVLLHRLRANALQTARAWPSWQQSSQVMALALHAVRREPPPAQRPSGMRLTSDIGTELAEQEMRRREAQDLNALLHDMWSQRAWVWSVKVRGWYHRARAPFGRIRRSLRRLVRR